MQYYNSKYSPILIISKYHHIKFLAHQFGSPLLESIFISIFRASSQINKIIEKVSPGIPSMKNGKTLNQINKYLPPKTPLSPGTYNNKIKIPVSSANPPNICLLNPE